MAHLTKSTKQPRTQPDLLSLEPDGSTDKTPSSSSLAKKPALKTSSTSNLSGHLRKYEQKYIKSPGKSDKKLLRRKSSVVFKVPAQVVASDEDDDSLFDDELIQYLNETSLSEEGNDLKDSTYSSFSETDKLKKIATVDMLKVEEPVNLKSNGLLKNSTIQNGSSTSKFLDTSGGNGDTRAHSRSLSYETSELKSIQEDISESIQNTSINTPETSGSKGILLKSNKGIFHSSVGVEDDSSSASNEYLSRRISRRNSYVYKEGMGLVNAISSDETIKTESEVYEVSDNMKPSVSQASGSSLQKVDGQAKTRVS